MECKDCRFFDQLPYNEFPGAIQEGRCKKNAPFVPEHGWMRVPEDDWCGEFKKRKDEGLLYFVFIGIGAIITSRVLEAVGFRAMIKSLLFN